MSDAAPTPSSPAPPMAGKSTEHRPNKKQEKKESKGSNEQTKIPKGTRDWSGADIQLRDKIFKVAGDIFARHGAQQLDTPVFELKHILAGKYGEDSKLIYDLADQGGEICALRYDLTVPFARWLAMNRDVKQIKRYHIAKVYRRDQPAVARGRMREFYQCDFDIAGEYDAMIPDAEILRIMREVFKGLGLGDQVQIKLNHRKILDGMFAVCGVPSSLTRSISSAVDKLDKSPWDEVKKEMLEKGLEEGVADKIGVYVKQSGTLRETIAYVKAQPELCADKLIQQGLDDMDLLQKYLEAFKVGDSEVTFDLALARGLDYYTGLIYEAVIELPTERSTETRVGSIAAGGRYDNLVGMYDKSKRQTPCIGVSFGVDRIFTILKGQHQESGQLRARNVEAYVMTLGGKEGLLVQRMAVASALWEAGIKAEFAAKVKPKLPQQFKGAEDAGARLAVIVGEAEEAEGKVKVKILGLPEGHPEKEGRLVSKEDMVAEVRRLLASDDELAGQVGGIKLEDKA
ncbi:histidyl-tRNA mitochondrial precursor [Coniochaeta sp. 2T2.1]|nr:histidyl-tRNA mitochondrial precursor [Coniochaeta sp. 2T2.1]